MFLMLVLDYLKRFTIKVANSLDNISLSETIFHDRQTRRLDIRINDMRMVKSIICIFLYSAGKRFTELETSSAVSIFENRYRGMAYWRKAYEHYFYFVNIIIL